MSEHKRTIVHEHKLETSTKLILAAIAVALVTMAVGLFDFSSEAIAEDQRSRSSIQRIIENCTVTGYVESHDEGSEAYLYGGSIDC